MGDTPRNQLTLRSWLALSNTVELDTAIRYVSHLGRPDNHTRDIPAYTGFDLRLAWQPSKAWELSLVGQNLFDNRHLEFTPSTIETQATEVERSIYGKVAWRL